MPGAVDGAHADDASRSSWLAYVRWPYLDVYLLDGCNKKNGVERKKSLIYHKMCAYRYASSRATMEFYKTNNSIRKECQRTNASVSTLLSLLLSPVSTGSGVNDGSLLNDEAVLNKLLHVLS